MNREKIKAWRVSQRLTQSEVAKLLGVTLATFSNFERGVTKTMIPDTMRRLGGLVRKTLPDLILLLMKGVPDDVTSYEPPLDPGIALYVEALVEGGIETYESCEGGQGHAYLEPTICFDGDKGAGFRALAIAFERGFPVQDLRKFWSVIDDEPVGPMWQMTFWGPGDLAVSLVSLAQHGHPGRELCDAT